MEVSEARKAQLRAAQIRYRNAHRSELNDKARRRRASNLPLAAKRMREYRKRKPEIIAAIEARRVRSEEQRNKFNKYRRKWAKENTHKQREHAHKRGAAKIGHLPSGTIEAIGDKQRWLCAACEKKLTAYHKDHIVPLARGGEHAPHNIQLLCPPCNLRKASRDPVAFMQGMGKLL